MGIEERLSHLERENRRLKIAGLLMLVLAASVFLMGQARPGGTVEAENFVVKDRRGVALAFLSTAYEAGSDVGQPMLGFYDPNGSIGTYLERSDGGTVLRVGTPGGGAVTITTRPDGEARVTASAAPGTSAPTINLRALPGGDTASVFTTSGDSVTSMMQYTRGGASGVVWLMDPSQQAVWTAP